MRVIAGEARGRSLKAVPGMSTRPTTDKVKEAVFSRIGPFFSGGYALDLFAGTGGLGIEALSRGIERCVFIDIESTSIQIIRDNLRATALEDRAEIYRNDAARALKVLSRRDIQFTLVFLDPPYRFKKLDDLVGQMEQYDLLADDAILVLEYDAAHEYPEIIGSFREGKKAVYGDIAVSCYYRDNDSATSVSQTDEVE